MTVYKLSPTDEELAALAARIPEGPIVIINLLKFQPDGGREAYARYMESARGASHPEIEILHAGSVSADVGGGEDWDYSIIARYPRFADFMSVVTSEAWRAADVHRHKALERTVMIVSPVESLSGMAAHAPE